MNIYQNFVFCTLTADCLSTDTTLSVDDLTRIPDGLDPFNPFFLTFESTFTADEFEVVAVTVKSASTGAGTITVTRGVDGTAFAHVAGTILKGALTSGMLNVIESEINAGYINNTIRGEYDPTTTYQDNVIVARRGGLFVTTGSPIGPADDPLLPDNWNTGFDLFYNDGDVSTRNSLHTGPGDQPKAAAGFQLAADTLVFGVLLEGDDSYPPADGTVTIGIATSLGGGTPTYIDSTTVVVVSAPQGRLQAIFDRPIALTASTQYYLVIEGNDPTLSFWQYQDQSHSTLFNGAGVLTDTTYDGFYDSTFSTNIGTGANRFIFFLWAAPSGSSNWDKLLERPFLGFDAHLGLLSSDRFGQVTRDFLPYPFDWHNQGGATWAEDFDHGLLTAPYVSSADNNRVVVRPLDSGWTEIISKLEVRVTASRLRSAGLCLRDSTSNNLLTIALSDDTVGLDVNEWNSETSLNTNAFSAAGAPVEDLATIGVPVPYYFKVTRPNSSSTTLDISVSREGRIWRTILTGFDNSWMSAAPDSVGFFAHSSGADSASVPAACMPIWLHVS